MVNTLIKRLPLHKTFKLPSIHQQTSNYRNCKYSVYIYIRKYNSYVETTENHGVFSVTRTALNWPHTDNTVLNITSQFCF